MSRAAPAIAAVAAAAAAIAAGAACRRSEPPAAGGSAGSAQTASSAAAAGKPGVAAGCTELPFAKSTPLPEASGAAWLTIDGAPGLLVISDSGNDGAYAIIDAESGETREEGKLPLGGPGKDLEGVAARGGKLHVLTSAGWVRVYERKDRGFALQDGPYPLGPIDLDDRGDGNAPPPGDGMVCAAKHANCGRNYEGLCLQPGAATGRGGGLAAAQADGRLYCLVERDGRLQVERDGAIEIARPGAVADCAFSDDGRLYVGTNLFDAGNVYRVTGWEDPARARVARLGPLLVGFPEVIAARGDVIYRMSDTGGAPSYMKKYRCPGR